MRRWIGRGCWLLAWGAWGWLGVGLYRELPRELGKPVCELPLQKRENAIGFLHGEETIVTRLDEFAKQRTRFCCYDARSGIRRRDWVGPSIIAMSTGVSLRHGVVFGSRPDRPLVPFDAFQLLDLRTGEWRTLSPMPWELLDFHSTKPWAIGRLSGVEGARVGVFDLETGKMIAEWSNDVRPAERPAEYLRTSAFCGDGDDFVVVLHQEDEEEGQPRRSTTFVERASVSRGRLGAFVSFTRSLSAPKILIGNERILADGWDDQSPALEVLELQTGRSVYALDVPEDIPSWRARPTTVQMNWPRLAASGRALMTWSGAVRRIDDGHILWAPTREYETVIERLTPRNTLHPAEEAFLVVEEWKKLFARWRLRLDWRTVAVRDLDTGSVFYRVWNSHPALSLLSSVGGLGVLDNKVYAFPLPVNWLLLAACQAALAAPLVGLWLLLRWRRNKLTRSRSKEAAP